MTTQQAFVEAARALVGTPFHPEGRCPGIGIDCIGVAVCAAVKCGIKHRDARAYPMRPNGRLLKELDAQLVRVLKPQPADIFAMEFQDEPHHVAVYAGDTLIHAYAQARKCVEQPMVEYWWDRVKVIYRFREFNV